MSHQGSRFLPLNTDGAIPRFTNHATGPGTGEETLQHRGLEDAEKTIPSLGSPNLCAENLRFMERAEVVRASILN